MRRANFIYAGLLLAIIALVFFEGMRVNNVAKYGVPEPVGPGIYLLILGCLLLVPVLFFIFRDVLPSAQVEGVIGRGIWRNAIVVGIIAGYTILIPLVGYLISTAFFFIIFFWVLGGYSRMTSIVLGLMISILFYFIFSEWLGMPLPVGFLGI